MNHGPLSCGTLELDKNADQLQWDVLCRYHTRTHGLFAHYINTKKVSYTHAILLFCGFTVIYPWEILERGETQGGHEYPATKGEHKKGYRWHAIENSDEVSVLIFYFVLHCRTAICKNF